MAGAQGLKMNVFVYVLRSHADQNFYVGITNDLRERYRRHCKGRVQLTKARRPLELIYKEVFVNYETARKRERFLKGFSGKEFLKSLRERGGIGIRA